MPHEFGFVLSCIPGELVYYQGEAGQERIVSSARLASVMSQKLDMNKRVADRMERRANVEWLRPFSATCGSIAALIGMHRFPVGIFHRVMFTLLVLCLAGMAGLFDPLNSNPRRRHRFTLVALTLAAWAMVFCNYHYRHQTRYQWIAALLIVALTTLAVREVPDRLRRFRRSRNRC